MKPPPNNSQQTNANTDRKNQKDNNFYNPEDKMMIQKSVRKSAPLTKKLASIIKLVGKELSRNHKYLHLLASLLTVGDILSRIVK